MCIRCTHVALWQRVVREKDYHIYEDIWEASQRENSICADPFTVTAAFRSKRERYNVLVSPFARVAAFFYTVHYLYCETLEELSAAISGYCALLNPVFRPLGKLGYTIPLVCLTKLRLVLFS